MKFDKEYLCHTNKHRAPRWAPNVTDATTIVKIVLQPTGFERTLRDSNSRSLVYETSVQPNELKWIPSVQVGIKQLVRTNTSDVSIAVNVKKVNFVVPKCGYNTNN